MTYPHIHVGIIVFHSKQYLESLLSSLYKQRDVRLSLEILDNANALSNDIQWIQEHYPNIPITLADNIGFSKGHNILFSKNIAEYYAAVNPDMYFDAYYFSELVQGLSRNTTCATASGKLFQWNFKEQKTTNILDSCGTERTQWMSFYERGQRQKDRHQFHTEEPVFGVSGTAMLVDRQRIIPALIDEKHLFCPEFFMYKEDIELALRMEQKGLHALYVPTAKAYHDRTALSGLYAQWTKPSYVIFHSLKNHYSILKNYQHTLSLFWKVASWGYYIFQFCVFSIIAPKTTLRVLFDIKKI